MQQSYAFDSGKYNKMYELQNTTHTVDNNTIHTRNHNYDS